MSSIPAWNPLAWLLIGALTATVSGASHAEAQNWRDLTSSRQLWDDEPITVLVSYGAGELTVGPTESDGLLYRMEMRYDEDRVAPVADFDSASRQLNLGLRGREGRGGRNTRSDARADIDLTDQIPIDLALRFGAGKATIDLSGLRLEALNLETGASETEVRIDEPNPIRAKDVTLKAGAAEFRVEGLGNLRAERITFQGGVGSTTLDFRGAWEQDASARVQMGMGSVVLRFPRSLGVRINRNAVLTSFDAAGFTRRDRSFFSENWDSAARQLTLDLDAAFGSVTVEWTDG